MLSKCILLVLLMASQVLGQTLPASTCVQTFGINKYDLSGANQKGSDYNVKDNAGNTYFVQPCQYTVYGCEDDMSQGSSYPTMFCQLDGGLKNHSLGNVLVGPSWTELSPPGTGIQVNITGGDNGRTGGIACSCSRTASGTSILPGSLQELPNKLYVITLVSKSCCPGAGPGNTTGGGKKGKFDFGWVFVIIVFGGLALYFIIGALFLKFGRDASGVEIIPQHDFWFSLPGLVKDGVMFIVNKIRGGNTYQTI